MSEMTDRKERKAIKEARQAKRAARTAGDDTTPAARKQARVQRRAERGQDAAGRVQQRAGKAGANAAKGGQKGKKAGKKREDGMQSYLDTMLIIRGNAERRRYPDRLHPACHDGALFPDFVPKFKLDLGPDAAAFTIGAGFARDLEPVLAGRAVTLPTTAVTIPPADFGRPENPLNEYAPATIAQRINAAFNVKPVPNSTVIPAGQLFSDQLMPGQFNDTMAMVETRRAEIAGIYARLRQCGAVIITLSTVESWYDTKSRRFFNRAPPTPIARSRSRHIFFDVQDVRGVTATMLKPLAALGEAGIKVVLTVSPAAQRTTQAALDAVTANELAKATLLIAAHRLAGKFGHVDYFPAYEIARSAGLSAYKDDNVQLRDEVAAVLTGAFIKAYAAG